MKQLLRQWSSKIKQGISTFIPDPPLVTFDIYINKVSFKSSKFKINQKKKKFRSAE